MQPCLGRKHGSNWNLGTFCQHCNGYVLLLNALGLVTDLPHSNNGVSDEDKKDDEGLHKGGDGLLTFLEPGQHLRSEGEDQVSDSRPEKQHAHMSEPLYYFV